MPKFSTLQRMQIDSIVANLSIKRIPESEILAEIRRQTGKTISRVMLFYIKRRIKKDSFKWYQKLKQGEYEYLHEFKQRIREIEDLINRHYKIIDDNTNSPCIQQTSLAELHRLNVTLSKYFDILPSLLTSRSQHSNNFINNPDADPIQISMQGFEVEKDDIYTRWEKEGKCTCKQGANDVYRHNKCSSCYFERCPKAAGQEWCPNPQCARGIKGNKFQPYDENNEWIKCTCGFWLKTQEILERHLAAYPHSPNANQPATATNIE